MPIETRSRTEKLEKLERELRKDSRNSSQPPRQDQPRRKRRPARPKGRSGKKQGAQPGHEGHGRELLPTMAVDEVVVHWPAQCGCGHAFSEAERVPVGEPFRHQVEELPEIATMVIEHQCPRVCGPECGAKQRARLPAEVAASAFGPRFQAAVVTLSVRNRVSRRDVVELFEQLFRARISTHGRRDCRPCRGCARTSRTT